MSLVPQPGGFSSVQQEPRLPRHKKVRKPVKVINITKDDDNSEKVIYKRNEKVSHKPNKVSRNIKIFSTNAAGVVTGKVESLRNEVKATKANIVTLQETHSTAKGQIIMNDSFVVFEAIRRAKHGGTMCAIHEDLSPKLIEEYNEQFELLVVEIKTNSKDISHDRLRTSGKLGRT